MEFNRINWSIIHLKTSKLYPWSGTFYFPIWKVSMRLVIKLFIKTSFPLSDRTGYQSTNTLKSYQIVVTLIKHAKKLKILATVFPRRNIYMIFCENIGACSSIVDLWSCIHVKCAAQVGLARHGTHGGQCLVCAGVCVMCTQISQLYRKGPLYTIKTGLGTTVLVRH